MGIVTNHVFVLGDYMLGIDNGDGTYTCEINSDASVNGYTAETAPIVKPIDTPGYSAQAALTGYTSLTEYMEAGMVYVHAGCRGKDSGAPAGVTDIKAAIRYVRYTDDIVSGDADRIFVFGMSGGITISGTYETASDYIDALNANGTWVTYDAESNTAAIASVSEFVKAFKGVSKNLGAFDRTDVTTSMM